MIGVTRRNAQLSRDLKAKLGSGQIATMIGTDHPSPSLAEKLGDFGFDAVLIDCEHGTTGPERVEEMARGAYIGGLVSIVRPEAGVPWLIRRYLECDVDGLMVPLVHDAGTTQAIVDAVRFACPFDHSDRFIVVMIESIDAVKNLDTILEVEGVDAFLVAPADLAKSMGGLGNRRDWEDGKRPQGLQEAIDGAIRTIVGAGRICGTTVSRNDIQACIDKGVRLLYTHANHILAAGAEEFLGRIRRAEAVEA